jgi:hypothetical protein
MAIGFEFWLEVLLAVLLALTVGYCFVLDRKLGTLRKAQGSFESLLADFTQATERAENSVTALRRASSELAAELDEKLEAGRALGDELTTITQSGDALAERIETGLLNRPREVAGGVRLEEREEAVTGRSESERELMRALRAAR